MIDREKVIGLLQETAEYFRECRSNASFASKAENHFCELQNAATEAVELLKEQEAVKPKQRNPHLGAWWYECGNCDTAISPSDNYCRGCGRVIDWSK